MFAPGVWATHTEPAPIFAPDTTDRGQGLEELAEDGNPAVLANTLAGDAKLTSGVFSQPAGSALPGPIARNDSYEFVVAAKPGASLSFATMLVETNDYFIAPGANGIPLFDGDGTPISGDVSDMLKIWDAGTEEDEWLGWGENQAPRQTDPGAGAPDAESTVRLLGEDSQLDPDFAPRLLNVSIEPLSSVPFTIEIENNLREQQHGGSTGAWLGRGPCWHLSVVPG